MSENSNTDEPVELTGDGERTLKMVVPETGVNAMLKALGGDIFPDASQLDAVLIEVDHSQLMTANWHAPPKA